MLQGLAIRPPRRSWGFSRLSLVSCVAALLLSNPLDLAISEPEQSPGVDRATLENGLGVVLDQAKALPLREVPLSESSVEAIAGGMISRVTLGLPLDEPIRAAHRYMGLNPEDVKAAFAKWFRPDDLVQVTEGPTPQ